MSLVGIIANPASGKDIRRVVSQATTVNNHEKVSIVRRLLLALFASGVNRVEIMPDFFGIGDRALDGLRDRADIQAATSVADLPVSATARDSSLAARYLREALPGASSFWAAMVPVAPWPRNVATSRYCPSRPGPIMWFRRFSRERWQVRLLPTSPSILTSSASACATATSA